MLELEAALQEALLRVAQHSLSNQDLGHAVILCRVFQPGFGCRFASRRLISLSRAEESSRPRMAIARWAAFRAPASPIATVATGMPAGIWAMDNSASRPPSEPPDIGTPITGRTLQAATTPGRCAAPPAAAINTFRPRSSAEVAHRRQPSGSRCADRTTTSYGTP